MKDPRVDLLSRIHAAEEVLLPPSRRAQLEEKVQSREFKHVILAVHGPSAAGKSELARQLVQELGSDHTEIISRDALIREHLDIFNRMQHRGEPQLTLSRFHALQNGEKLETLKAMLNWMMASFRSCVGRSKPISNRSMTK